MPTSRFPWLVTGASGLLGANFLIEAKRENDHLVAQSRGSSIISSGVVSVCADLADEKSAISLVEKYLPSTVFHLAAATDVEWCEDHPKETFLINAAGTRSLAKACRQFGARMIYMSTDSVFDGQRGNYTEYDQPTPINVYARSKLEGERAVREELDDHVIVRANIFGWNALPKKSLVEWMLGLLDEGHPVPGFTDLIFAPLLVNHLSKIMMNLAETEFRGTIHAASRPMMSKFDFAQHIARVFGYSPDVIQPKLAKDVVFKAPRPLNTCLDPSQLERLLGINAPLIEAEIVDFRTLRDSGERDLMRKMFHAKP